METALEVGRSQQKTYIVPPIDRISVQVRERRGHGDEIYLAFPLRRNRCPSVMANGLMLSPFGLSRSACAPIG